MRVTIKPITGKGSAQYGDFLGVLESAGCERCGEGSYIAVRLDGNGLLIDLVHPSRVEMQTITLTREGT